MKSVVLQDGEKLLWQGRPAPRCYTFRYWKQAVLGGVLFLLSSFWLMLAYELAREGEPRWLMLIPLPLIVGSFVFGPLQIILSRLRWPRQFYQLTDLRLLSNEQGALSLAEIAVVKQKSYGARLVSLRFETAAGTAVTLICIEQPGSLLALLREHCPHLEI